MEPPASVSERRTGRSADGLLGILDVVRHRRLELQAPAGDVIAQFSWRSLKARLLAHDGRLTEAEPLAMEALSLVMQTDALTDQGDVLLAVGTVLAAANRPAAERVRQAIELYERKQNAASARNARARLAGAEVV